jgi:large conductance mechanosensitive channel
MQILKDFKAFVMRGNVVDMAVGVIIGGAFGKIVSSVVNDVLMPPIGMLLGGVNFRDLLIPLDGNSYKSLEEAVTAGAPVIKIGLFINTVIDFLIVAAVIFFVINKMVALAIPKGKPGAPEAPTTKECPECLESVKIKARKCSHCGSALTA